MPDQRSRTVISATPFAAPLAAPLARAAQGRQYQRWRGSLRSHPATSFAHASLVHGTGSYGERGGEGDQGAGGRG